MKNSRFLAWLLAVSMASPVLCRADSLPVPVPPAASKAAPGEEKKTDLEARMGKIGKAVRKLKKQVSDPAQNASSLQLVAAMRDAAKEAAAFTPAKAEDLPQDQRAKFVEDFKAGLKELDDRLARLQDAFAAGKNEDAAAIFADLQDFERKEHKQFKKPKPD